MTPDYLTCFGKKIIDSYVVFQFSLISYFVTRCSGLLTSPGVHIKALLEIFGIWDIWVQK